MLLTLTLTRPPATDLGFLLQKHPGQRAFGRRCRSAAAHVFYPEASEERCTAAVTLEVDPGRAGARQGRRIEASNTSTTGPMSPRRSCRWRIGQRLRHALGRAAAKQRQELADAPLPLEARLDGRCRRAAAATAARGCSSRSVTRVDAVAVSRSTPIRNGGTAPTSRVRLAGELRLATLLTHLYVLIPVLDDDKHYYVGDDEVEKLLRKGEGWLAAHPARELIVRRYLRGFGGARARGAQRAARRRGPKPMRPTSTRACARKRPSSSRSA